MINMNPTPAIIIDDKDDMPIYCTQEESRDRHNKCKDCKNFYKDDDEHTKCMGCGCNISMMITFKFKECPLGNW